MTTRVDIRIERECTQYGEYSFSTRHNPDIVEKWLLANDGANNGDDIANEIQYWDDTYNEKVYIDSSDYHEGEGDEYCNYDNEIQRWMDANTVDMNLIFSSGCDIQKITDFIKKNEELYNSLSKKKMVTDLTDDEKDVFYGLREIAGLSVPLNI